MGSAGRGSNHPLENWFTCSQGNTTHGVDQNTNVAPKETATTRKGKGVENTTQFKRPRVTGMGVLQAKNGFKNFNVSIAMHSYCLFSNNLHIYSLIILVL